MTSDWYLLKKGKADGPMSLERIEAALKEGGVGPYDLIYRTGDSKWRVIAEIPQLQAILVDLAAPPRTDQWILLTRQGRKDGSYVQKGPFTRDQILAMIKAGECRYGDYVWREGMKEWYRIASLSEFNPTEDKVSLPEPPNFEVTVVFSPEALQTPTEQALATVQAAEKAGWQPLPGEASDMDNEPPPEAAGPDLVAESRDESVDADRTVIAPLLAKPAPGVVERVEPAIETGIHERTGVTQSRSRVAPPETRRRPSLLHLIFRPTLLHLFLVLVLVAAAGLRIFLSVREDQRVLERFESQRPEVAVTPQPVPKPAPAPPAPSAPAPVPEPVPVAPPVVETPPPRPAEPTELPGDPAVEFSWQDLGGKSPKLMLKWTGGKIGPITVTIWSLPGRIVRDRSVFLKLPLKSTLQQEVELARFDMPAGEYQMSVEFADREKRTAFFVGKNDRAFRDARASHRKKMAHVGAAERRDLHRLIKQMESAFNSGSLSEWRVVGRGRLDDVNAAAARRLAFGLYWMRLKDLKREGGDLIKSKAAGSAAEKEEISAFQYELKKVRSEIEQSSLF